VWFDDFLTREADVTQQTDAVFDDAVVDEQLITDSRADDDQHRLDETVTLSQHPPTVRAL